MEYKIENMLFFTDKEVKDVQDEIHKWSYIIGKHTNQEGVEEDIYLDFKKPTFAMIASISIKADTGDTEDLLNAVANFLKTARLRVGIVDISALLSSINTTDTLFDIEEEGLLIRIAQEYLLEIAQKKRHLK